MDGTSWNLVCTYVISLQVNILVCIYTVPFINSRPKTWHKCRTPSISYSKVVEFFVLEDLKNIFSSNLTYLLNNV